MHIGETNAMPLLMVVFLCVLLFLHCTVPLPNVGDTGELLVPGNDLLEEGIYWFMLSTEAVGLGMIYACVYVLILHKRGEGG